MGFLAAFIGGLALNLTPCVYPMIPVTLAFFTQQARGSWQRVVRLAGVYILGISLSYAALGFVAAKTGALLGAWLQQPSVLVAVAGVILALSLSLFGFYDFRLPQVINRRLTKAWSGPWGAFFMGIVVGLVAAPCVGPFVLGLVLFVSHLAHPVQGFLLFFVMGLGMGLPYLVLATAAHRLGQLPRAGEWLIWSKKALGCVLLGLALYFLRPLFSSAVAGWSVTGLLLGTGLYLGWLQQSQASNRVFLRIRQLVGSVLIGVAIAVAWPKAKLETQVHERIQWVSYTEAAFEQARSKHQPIIIDVYADWCLPCVEMDQVTFRHPDVVKALGFMQPFRIDATLGVSADAQALFDRYDIFGVPTLLLFDRFGKERSDLRLLGFEGPEYFLERLRHIQ